MEDETLTQWEEQIGAKFRLNLAFLFHVLSTPQILPLLGEVTGKVWELKNLIVI